LRRETQWAVLISSVGGSEKGGKHLKAKNYWDSNGNGQDTYDFAAFPSGNGYSDGRFGSAGYHGYWWGSSYADYMDNYSGYYANYIRMDYYSEHAKWYQEHKSRLFSVRCLQSRSALNSEAITSHCLN
jgi:uncharacterized protein (TIGR02145 family)